ncbi:KTSC domain-containing protein [Chitinophaga qingshengii]|uniref:KTSC domain-containing protein n=1 Tax=Chitinophaga qingshengii TaxID=1569794 RepID=A0ABR7TM71_9BACT|nr:KTSC domain-containing protein [Chitinophaga qingshengii]MBC9930628.1 KTSC domain-containing protein [Chitinophaga qingshengii]
MPSSVIRAFYYDAPHAVLRIVFVSGAVYDYQAVPASVYEAMRKAFSKGTFFNNEIKDKFEFSRYNKDEGR